MDNHYTGTTRRFSFPCCGLCLPPSSISMTRMGGYLLYGWRLVDRLIPILSSVSSSVVHVQERGGWVSTIRVAAAWPSDTHTEVCVLLCRPRPRTGWVTITRTGCAVVVLIPMLWSVSFSVVHIHDQDGWVSTIRVAAGRPSDTHTELCVLVCRPRPRTGWVTITRVRGGGSHSHAVVCVVFVLQQGE